MIVDLAAEDGTHLMRIESDNVPRVGETILMFEPERAEYLILSAQHIIKPRITRSDFRHELVTLTVKAI